MDVVGRRIDLKVQSCQDLTVPITLPRAPRIDPGQRRSGSWDIRISMSGGIRLEEGSDLESQTGQELTLPIIEAAGESF